MSEQNIIFADDPTAAVKVTKELWQSLDGKLFLTEESARNHSATHSQCKVCGNAAKKHYSACEFCAAKERYKRFLSRQYVEYDGQPTFLWDDGETFFRDEDEIIEFLEESDDPTRTLDLETSEPRKFRQLCADYWSDDLFDDEYDLPPALTEAIEALNAVIDSLPHAGWVSGNKRTTYKSEQPK